MGLFLRCIQHFVSIIINIFIMMFIENWSCLSIYLSSFFRKAYYNVVVVFFQLLMFLSIEKDFFIFGFFSCVCVLCDRNVLLCIGWFQTIHIKCELCQQLMTKYVNWFVIRLDFREIERESHGIWYDEDKNRRNTNGTDHDYECIYGKFWLKAKPNDLYIYIYI